MSDNNIIESHVFLSGEQQQYKSGGQWGDDHSQWELNNKDEWGRHRDNEWGQSAGGNG